MSTLLRTCGAATNFFNSYKHGQSIPRNLNTLNHLSKSSVAEFRRFHSHQQTLTHSILKSNITIASCAPLSTGAEEAVTSVPADGKETDAIEAAAKALDIRVGRVLRAWKHPDADSLLVEEVEIGEPEPRIICSGLVKYVPQEELQGSHVVVLANLKPRNMRGVKSNGMLLAASDASHENVELIRPPEGSSVGERIWFGPEEVPVQNDPASPNQVQKRKFWELVQPHLKTRDDCVIVLGNHPMRTSAGLVFCKSLKNANVA